MADRTPEDPTREMTLGEVLQKQIRDTDHGIEEAKFAEAKAQPPVVQEIVLARRHMEDANNRFKKAYNQLPDGDR